MCMGSLHWFCMIEVDVNVSRENLVIKGLDGITYLMEDLSFHDVIN